MTIVEIKAAIAAKLGIASIGTTSLVRQYDERKLTAVDIAVTVKTASGEAVISFDKKNPDSIHFVKTPWVSHWDNDHRLRMTMHEDIMSAISASRDSSGVFTKSDLAFKYELVQPSDKAPYHRFVVITPRDIEANF
jgi:hypothetical protein